MATDAEKKEAMGKRYCYEFKNNGSCARGDECWYMHALGGM
jgi:Zinc finger C-x8-C-x5-C-x3-H type (and similar)